jgi:hypothetical protein
VQASVVRIGVERANPLLELVEKLAGMGGAAVPGAPDAVGAIAVD